MMLPFSGCSRSRTEYFAPPFLRCEFLNLKNKAQISGCTLLKLDSSHNRQFPILIHNPTHAGSMMCSL